MALTTNLVAYYKLDESSGNAADSVGSNTLTNINTVGYAAGKINNGADFGSGNTNKNLRGTNWLSNSEIQSTWSISMWVNPYSLPSSGTTAGFAVMYVDTGAGSKRGFSLQYSGTSGEFIGILVISDALPSYYSNTTLSTSTWQHLVFTYDATNLKIYLNGSQIMNTAMSFNTRGDVVNVNTGTLAGDYSGGTLFNPASVKMDEVGVWTQALSSTDVTSLYNGGTGIQYPFSATTNSNFLAFM